MLFNPHKLGVHKVLQHIPLNALFDAPYKRALAKAVNIADLRTIAKARSHKMVFDYLDAGADDEISLRRGKDAYSELEMHFKILSGLKPPLDLSTKIFGMDVDLPFFGCPTAGNRMFHWEGEAAAAKASEKFGTLYGLSSLATTGIEEIGNIHSGPKVFQLYVWKDRELVKDVIAKAKEGGFGALALTVDFTWYGNRERDIRNDFSIPPKYSVPQMIEAVRKPAWTYDFLSHEPYTYACINTEVPADSLAAFVNSQIAPEFNWQDAEWLLGEWNGPAAPKGVCRPEDAKKAVEIGFSSIWVSNHGARQLETSPATIDVLPSIREAVGPDVEIIMDGGVQRGTDIAKALALGADSVGVGKPYLWGLAAGGEAGVSKAYDILKVELDRAMGLLGTGTVDQLKQEGPSLIKRRGASSRDYPDRFALDRGYGGGIV
uniref:FMN hydroxy acid dehydrogenase domain-containing protein n=1 Tax=Pseudo-nitzschia australis TaxID=44445 RepID=A0A6U9YWH2_9STRA|mmetsp:Transcript_15002/g.32128  ORF Transcript_15002/g.32128 Transcript_15002/m.32128 type:complete len:432 (-) Transcript_15002:381-1676(-)|eukprot:CAMPEP_0168173008 /NCGR_PEP_ID=MMETSP0139_2-20121125/5615_1 /TAXON_ID=44445 /ORGANISM="Pseudo-nitzschia australis, Strain 10249 10 AB" /LENGTH=431 /DNA_ID=CAMNT_0008090811 /DNA_START=217 /DNA_END=1512 /DNA_ORIENTATION=+